MYTYIYWEQPKIIVLKLDVRGHIMKKSTTIRVSEETKIELKKLGTMDDSYNTVISRLIKEHNQKKQTNE